MTPADPHDPFAALDSGRTFMMPTPGARPASSAPPMQNAPGADVTIDIAAVDSGMNPLLALANRLLAVVPHIRSTTHLSDPTVLKDSLAQGIRDFEARARQQGIAPERVMAARYILCTLLDEAAAGTPWGGSGTWGRYSLLAMFHNETWGGEKVFQLMAKLAENPAGNRDLLELIYAAVNLGFEGRYRVIEGGRAQLEAVRDRLAQIVKKERGGHPQPLAQNWRGQTVKRRALLSWLPLWVSGAVASIAVLGLYLALSFSLGGMSDPAYGEIQSLRLAPPTPPTPLPAPKPRLVQFLSSEIRAGLVAVRDEVDRSVITLRGDNLFDPGSASLSDEREALMRRIAEALAQVPGSVVITGHTDNQPIRSARFPSNWHLSEERAKAVRGILVSQGVTAARVNAEGRADGEPLVANDTAANRALNRRVEITLLAGKTEPKARSGS
ncbi:putative lipoprotein YiaD [Burkholderiaceae bacterium]|nr:putative lipoprotein YiaD [Burkholderiaceae bacterium]